MVEVNLPLVVGAALIDGINPCAFGVLIFLLAYLAKSVRKPHRLLTHGLIYIGAVFATYLAAGLLLLPVIQQLGKFSVWSYISIAVIVIGAGLLEIKDFFWYGKGFTLGIIPSEVERIKMYVARTSEKHSTSFFLGVFVALVELPCTGAVYLAVLSLMTLAGVTVTHIWFLILYNLIFVLPLVIILWAVYKGISTKKFEQWRQKHKGLMRLAIGLLLVAMGVWMLITVSLPGFAYAG